MILEDQRFLHEDIERLEQAISDRILDEPSVHRERLRKEHLLAKYLSRIESQSKKLLRIYADDDGSRSADLKDLTMGDNFDSFYSQLADIKDFHRRYPNERVENLEAVYHKPGPREPVPADAFVDIEHMFTGEESFGKFLDLTTLHEQYLNLPGIKGGRRVSYLQYLDLFDVFVPPKCLIKRQDKVKDLYFQYLTKLSQYLESFLRRTRPLENLDVVFSEWDQTFVKTWNDGKVQGWSDDTSDVMDQTQDNGTANPLWCAACQKQFGNQNLFDHHLVGKKHKRAAAQLESNSPSDRTSSIPQNSKSTDKSQAEKVKEEAVASREFRVFKLAGAMQIVRDDTKVNVERKQVLTDRERQQELAALHAEMADAPTIVSNGANGPSNGSGGVMYASANGAFSRGDGNEDDDSDDEERIYNPLKLPLAWDGKPIPYWLYKLHGLGVEFPCEICGNFVYMGRRAFDKHFNEAKHLAGLRCLGITDTTLFREVILIEDALKLQDKIARNKKTQKNVDDNVVQMEDADGNVMPEKVYHDLQKQGLL